jgi:hypothetical protein
MKVALLMTLALTLSVGAGAGAMALEPDVSSASASASVPLTCVAEDTAVFWDNFQCGNHFGAASVFYVLGVYR